MKLSNLHKELEELKQLNKNIEAVAQAFKYEMLNEIMEEYDSNIFESLQRWREERGLTPDNVKVSPTSVVKRMMSELVEALEAIEKGDFEGWIDGIVDACIFAINGLEQNNVDAEIAFDEVLKEIHSRKGKYNPETQKFEKQITGNEYKADHSKAIRKEPK